MCVKKSPPQSQMNLCHLQRVMFLAFVESCINVYITDMIIDTKLQQKDYFLVRVIFEMKVYRQLGRMLVDETDMEHLERHQESLITQNRVKLPSKVF